MKSFTIQRSPNDPAFWSYRHAGLLCKKDQSYLSCTQCQGLLTNYLICIAKTKDLKQKELGRTSSTVLKASVLGVPWGLSGSVATVLSINISAMSTLSIKRRSRYHFTSEKKIKEVIFNSYKLRITKNLVVIFILYVIFKNAFIIKM